MKAYTILLFLLIIISANSIKAQENTKTWTNYRGPENNGKSSAKNIPVSWNDSTNIAWRTSIPGKAWSSPVVFDNKIWITTALDEGENLRLLSVDAQNGKILKNLHLFKKDSLQKQHPLNSFASPSPVIEEGRVYAHFGSYGTACVNTETGEILWSRTDLHCDHEVGPGSSPLLYRNLLILTFDGTDVRFLIALDKNTGKMVWKSNRTSKLEELPPTNRKAFTTPIIAKINGEDQLISVGAHAVMGYNPSTGEEIWNASFKGFSSSTCPLIEEGVLYFNTGFSFASVLALELGETGNITGNIKWVNKKSNQARSSALIVDGLLYMVNTGGYAKCLIPETGEELWSSRVGKQTSASPIFVEGKIYTFDQEGLTTVFKPGKEFEKIGENKLTDGFMASPAAIDNALILRSKSHLYKIAYEN